MMRTQGDIGVDKHLWLKMFLIGEYKIIVHHGQNHPRRLRWWPAEASSRCSSEAAAASPMLRLLRWWRVQASSGWTSPTAPNVPDAVRLRWQRT